MLRRVTLHWALALGLAQACSVDEPLGVVDIAPGGQGGSVQSAGDTRIAHVAVGSSHACALTTEGVAYCWGQNERGQLGVGDLVPRLAPTAVLTGERFVNIDVSKSDGHTCALTAAGALFCWGDTTFGQLGTVIEPGHEASPIRVPTDRRFTKVSVGAAHSCGLGVDQRVYCWGSDVAGELGRGDIVSTRCSGCCPDKGCSADVAPIASAARFHDVDVAIARACALSDDGTAVCWGLEKDGGFGNGDVTTEAQPTPVAALQGLRLESLQLGMVSCGLAENGTSYCWGRGDAGALGIGADATRQLAVCSGQTLCSTSPRRIAFDEPFTALAPGFTVARDGPATAGSFELFACAIGAEGRAYCWGHQTAFTQQLMAPCTLFSDGADNGPEGCTPLPTTTAPGYSFSELRAGAGAVCGVTTQQRLVCWGDNSRGLLGNGSQSPAIGVVEVDFP